MELDNTGRYQLSEDERVLVRTFDGGSSTAGLTLLADLLEGRPFVALAAEQSGEDLLDEVLRRREAVPSDLRVVDIGERQRSAAAAGGSDPSTPIRGVSRATAPTDVAAELRTALEEVAADGRAATVYVDSLEPLLAPESPDETVTALDGLVDHLRSVGATGAFRLPPSAREANSLVEPLFDAVVERCPDSGEWTELPSVNPLSLDEIFDTLRIERRRQLLRVLASTRRAIPLEELAKTVAERLAAPGNDAVEVCERVRVSLYQIDVPKLADAGIVSWHADRRLVTPNPTLLDQFRPYLALSRGAD